MTDLKEVIRLLMHQVREEQATRLALDRALAGKEAIPVPTDVEVEERIKELQEVVKETVKIKMLTSKGSRSKI